jgi:hypothetical protein
MTRSRKRIWPHFFRTVGAMLDHGAVVRAGCARCGTIFDVDLHAIVARRGRDYSLIDKELTCKVTRCRGTSFFLAAARMESALITLLNVKVDPLQVEGRGLRPIDLEPPEPPDNDAPAQRLMRA